MAIASYDLNAQDVDIPTCPNGCVGLIVCGQCGAPISIDAIRAAQDELKARVRERVAAGEAVKHVAEAEGIAHQTVAGWTKDTPRPLTVVGRDGRARPSRKPKQNDVDVRRAEVSRLTAQGLSGPEIAVKLGMATQTIYNDRSAISRSRGGRAKRTTKSATPAVLPWGGPAARRAPKPISVEGTLSGQKLVNKAHLAIRDLADLTERFGGIPVLDVRGAERMVAEWQQLLPRLKFEATA